MLLNEIPIGKKVKIKKVLGEGALRRRLLDMGLTPGAYVEIKKIAPMGDPVELFLRGYSLSIRLEDARKIEIEEVSL